MEYSQIHETLSCCMTADTDPECTSLAQNAQDLISLCYITDYVHVLM